MECQHEHVRMLPGTMACAMSFRYHTSRTWSDCCVYPAKGTTAVSSMRYSSSSVVPRGRGDISGSMIAMAVPRFARGLRVLWCPFAVEFQHAP